MGSSLAGGFFGSTWWMGLGGWGPAVVGSSPGMSRPASFTCLGLGETDNPTPICGPS